MKSTKIRKSNRSKRTCNLVTGLLNHFGSLSVENLTEYIKNRSDRQSIETIMPAVRQTLSCGIRHGFFVKHRNKFSLSSNYEIDGGRGNSYFYPGYWYFDRGYWYYGGHEGQASGEQASGEQASGEQASGEQASGEQASGEQAYGEQAYGEQAYGEHYIQGQCNQLEKRIKDIGVEIANLKTTVSKIEKNREKIATAKESIETMIREIEEYQDSIQRDYKICLLKHNTTSFYGCRAKDLMTFEPCRRYTLNKEYCFVHQQLQILLTYRMYFIEFSKEEDIVTEMKKDKYLNKRITDTPKISDTTLASYLNYFQNYIDYIFKADKMTEQDRNRRKEFFEAKPIPIRNPTLCVAMHIEKVEQCDKPVYNKICLDHFHIVTLLKVFSHSRCHYNDKKYFEQSDIKLKVLQHATRKYENMKSFKEELDKVPVCVWEYLAIIVRLEIQKISNDYETLGRSIVRLLQCLNRDAQKQDKDNCICVNPLIIETILKDVNDNMLPNLTKENDRLSREINEKNQRIEELYDELFQRNREHYQLKGQ